VKTSLPSRVSSTLATAALPVTLTDGKTAVVARCPLVGAGSLTLELAVLQDQHLEVGVEPLPDRHRVAEVVDAVDVGRGHHVDHRLLLGGDARARRRRHARERREDQTACQRPTKSRSAHVEPPAGS